MKEKKKSAVVTVSLLAVMAGVISAGCSSTPSQVRRCVDQNGKVLPDAECERPRGGYYGAAYAAWAYGGRGGTTPGSKAMGFTRTPSPNANVVTPSGRVISRGGFGGSSGARSGGVFGGFG